MTTAGSAAMANPITDLAEQVQDALGGADDGEAGEGDALESLLGELQDLAPEELQELFDALDPAALEELLDLLDLEEGDDGADENDGEPADGAAPDTGDLDVPGADLGGFHGVAGATGLSIRVGLPEEIADPLQPVFEALGIAAAGGDDAIALDLAQTNAELHRAAEGEDVGGLANALILNALLGSEAADQPGSCTGGDTVPLPDADTPVLTLTLADIDCDQDDERAYASAHVAGVNINLGNLIDLAGADALRDGLDELLEPVNTEILAAINEQCGTLFDPLGDLFDQLGVLSLDAAELCDALELHLDNFLDVEVPLLNVDLLEASSEVTYDDDVVTATASSGLVDLQLAGLVCVEGNEPGQDLVFSSTASTDGETGTADAQGANATVRLCQNSPLAQIIDAEGLLNSIEIADRGVADLLGETVEPVTAGLEEGLQTLLVDTENSLSTVTEIDEDGAGAAAAARLDVLSLQLFRGIDPLAETPLGDITVNVSAMDTSAGVNAEPDDPRIPAEVSDPEPEEPAEPTGELPRTGASAAGLFGLAAMGAAIALRRRDD